MLTINPNDPFSRNQGQGGMCSKSSYSGASALKGSFATPPPSPFSSSSSSSSTSSKESSTGKSQSGSNGNNGSWGPVFKNKDHFASLHFC